VIALIGGTGLGKLTAGFDRPSVLGAMNSPWGSTSGPVLNYGRFLFLPRFGVDHEYPPSFVPYQANIFALKDYGVTTIVSISAVGSLHRHVKPGTLVFPDQLIDRTKRPSSFFDQGRPVAHVSMREPFCGKRSIFSGNQPNHCTYLCMEGPALSTRAESIENSGVATVIGMTVGTEARLCREAQICYVPICMVTDYDLSDDSNAETIARNASETAGLALNVFVDKLPQLEAMDDKCSCRRSLEASVISTGPKDSYFSVLAR
jgi:5'-methylthioadenosine phosphorylase